MKLKKIVENISDEDKVSLENLTDRLKDIYGKIGAEVVLNPYYDTIDVKIPYEFLGSPVPFISTNGSPNPLHSLIFTINASGESLKSMTRAVNIFADINKWPVSQKFLTNLEKVHKECTDESLWYSFLNEWYKVILSIQNIRYDKSTEIFNFTLTDKELSSETLTIRFGIDFPKQSFKVQLAFDWLYYTNWLLIEVDLNNVDEILSQLDHKISYLKKIFALDIEPLKRMQSFVENINMEDFTKGVYIPIEELK